MSQGSDITLCVKAAHAADALKILRAKGYPPVERQTLANGAILFRFGLIGDDLSYAIAGALPLEYHDLHLALAEG